LLHPTNRRPDDRLLNGSRVSQEGLAIEPFGD
jgi:hypothetical protein